MSSAGWTRLIAVLGLVALVLLLMVAKTKMQHRSADQKILLRHAH